MRTLTVDSEPLVLVLALGQLDDLAEAASTKSHFGILSQLVAGSTALADARPELVLGALVANVDGIHVSRRVHHADALVLAGDDGHVGRVLVNGHDRVLDPRQRSVGASCWESCGGDSHRVRADALEKVALGDREARRAAEKKTNTVVRN